MTDVASHVHLTSEDLEESFEDAAACVQSAVTSGHQLSNDDKLEIYGLYKQATEGICKSYRPNFLYVKERAKWDSWKKLGDMTQQTAKIMYISKVQTLFPQQEDQGQSRAGPSGGGAVVSTLITAEPDADDLLVMGTVHRLAEEGKDAELANRLEHGEDPNQRDSDGNTPLHWACDRGVCQVVETLLRHKADINARNEDGHTPLHFATIAEQAEVVRLLLSSGADPGIKDASGETARVIASTSSPCLLSLFPE